MFRHLFKVIHLVSMGAFGGALLVTRLLTADERDVQVAGIAALRTAIANVSDAIVLPSLVLMLLSGMLLVVMRPMLISANWLRAKVVIGAVVGALAIFVVQPGVRHAAVVSNEASVGAPGGITLQRALAMERIGSSISIVLVILAVALAVARPRLGQRELPMTPDDSAASRDSGTQSDAGRFRP